MKVLLIGNYKADRQYSMQGFANALLSGFCERGVEAHLATPPEILGRWRIPKVNKWLGYGDKFLAFPPQLRRMIQNADVVHICDQGNTIYTKYLSSKPHLVTCHDLLAIRAARGELPDQKTGATGRIFQKMILAGLLRAQAIACVSETTRRDLLRIGNVPKERVSVLYNGLYRTLEAMPESQSEVILNSHGIASDIPFLLHIGGNQFYKNRMGLLQIVRALSDYKEISPMRMVMAGKPFTPEMRQYVTEHHLENRVVELVEPDNETLRALYSRAKALIFPSLYEGFGLPIIEAQSCGCPVFASNRAPMTEVGGEGAIYFDPTQPAQAAETIAANFCKADAMKEAGFRNVTRFTTERMVDDYIRAYQNMLVGRPIGAAE